MKYFVIFYLSISTLLHANTISLETMVSQMLIVGFDGYKEGDKWVEQIAKDIKRSKIGGVVIGSKNIQSPSQLKQLIQYLKAQAPEHRPLMVVLDDEGGEESILSVQKGFLALPLASKIVQQYDVYAAEAVYQKKAKELKTLGITICLAPVLDLATRALSSSERRYGFYEEIVLTYAQLYIDALRLQGIVPIVKYFPTAGRLLENDFGAKEDVSDVWRFEQLKPYYDLIAMHKLEGVVISHAFNSTLDPKAPAIFSSVVIEGLLRSKMHFEGVVFADHLRHDSIVSTIDFKTRIVKAVQAGVDVLVFPNYFADNASTPFTATNTLLQALQKSELSKERIELSYQRILALHTRLTTR